MSVITIDNKNQSSGRASTGLKDSNGTVLSVGTITDGEFLKISGSTLISSLSELPSTQVVPNSGSRLSLTSSFITLQMDTGHAYMALIGEDLTNSHNWIDLGVYPSFPSNLVLHLDAYTLSDVGNGGSVSQWNDLSGNGHNVYQSNSGNQPVYYTSSANNRPGVLFAGGLSGPRNYMDGTVDSSMIFSGVTTIMVCKKLGDGVNNGWMFVEHADNQLYYGIVDMLAGQFGFSYKPVDGSWGDHYMYTSPTTLSIRTVRLDDMNSNLINAWRNDTLTNTEYGSGAIDNSSATTFTIGGYYSSTFEEYYYGIICELMVFNRALSDTEISFLHSYLKFKWGIS